MKPETIWSNASRLLADDKVAARIASLRESMARRVEIDRAWVLEGLIENYNRAMTASPVLDRDGKETGEFTYQGNVANKALELVGKEIGMFVDRKEVGKPGEFTNLDDSALDRAIRDEAERLGFVLAPDAREESKTQH